MKQIIVSIFLIVITGFNIYADTNLQQPAVLKPEDNAIISSNTNLITVDGKQYIKKPMKGSGASGDAVIMGVLTSLCPPLFGGIIAFQTYDYTISERWKKYNRRPVTPENINFDIGLSIFNLGFVFVDPKSWWVGTIADLTVMFYPDLFGLTVYENVPSSNNNAVSTGNAK